MPVLVLAAATLSIGEAWSNARVVECRAGGGQDDAKTSDSEAANRPELVNCRDHWGIEVLGIRRTSAGYMLDFRYRVLEPEKAKSLLDRKIKPYLIVENGGTELQVPVSPKIGPLRQSSAKVYPDRNYFMLFGNPARQVKAGDKVTVVVGDFRAEHLVVE